MTYRRKLKKYYNMYRSDNVFYVFVKDNFLLLRYIKSSINRNAPVNSILDGFLRITKTHFSSSSVFLKRNRHLAVTGSISQVR